jgi:hypothetical protein
MHQNLLNVISSCRPHNSSSVFNPPSTTTVKEQSSYCDPTPGQNIAHIGQSPNGMRIYLSRDAAISPDVFLAQNAGAISAFSAMLVTVAQVYGIRSDAVNVMYDTTGATIAFNLSGAIFCNIRFFLQLHWPGLQNHLQGREERYREAAIWWWVVVAHEVAHNVVREHNARHSYYTEMLVAQYATRMMGRAMMGSGPGASVNTQPLQIEGSAGDAPPDYSAAVGGGR